LDFDLFICWERAFNKSFPRHTQVPRDPKIERIAKMKELFSEIISAAAMSAPLPFHPLADIFPLIEGAEFDALVADIAANGLSQAIVVLDNQILDGRNRYRACLKAGVQHRVMPYRGKDPLTFVISSNLYRRHLSESQRAMVAAKLATLKRGDNQHSPIGETSQGRAAELLNVGKRSVERAAEVRDHGAPELQQAVEQGRVSVSAAADVATLPKQEQAEIVARGEKDILETAKAIRAEKAKNRYDARILRIAQTSAGNAALPNGQRYPLIYADPPWDYRLYNETTGSSRAAAEHYPTMKLDEICALPVVHLAAENAILFLVDYGAPSARIISSPGGLGLRI
jgi:hypothetical protein